MAAHREEPEESVGDGPVMGGAGAAVGGPTFVAGAGVRPKSSRDCV